MSFIMERRRAGAKRPHNSEESQYWTQASASLSALTRLHADSTASDTITRVNKWMDLVPQEDAPTGEGLDNLKSVYTKLTSGLKEIKASADKEVKLIEDTLEHLSVIKALRETSEGSSQDPKRIKRLRLSSPASNPASPFGIVTPPLTNSQGSSLARGRSRKDFLSRQLPLQPGRKVAFLQPAASNGKGADNADAEPQWILAEVTRCLNAEKNRYEVQDADEQEEGESRIKYTTTIKSLAPLPDPSAPLSSPLHPNAYGDYPIGSIVMALYPETTTFYRAVVVAGPKDPPPPGFRTVPGGRSQASYHLKFDDDGGQTRVVGVQWVVDWPHS